MLSPIILGLRAAQLIFSFVILGLSAYGMKNLDPYLSRTSLLILRLSCPLVQCRHLDFVAISDQLAPLLLNLHDHISSLSGTRP